jgi:Restriction endonuclease XhoI
MPQLFHDAVRYYWQHRDTAQQRQLEGGAADAGFRSAVTSGGHMDGFILEIRAAIAGVGYPEASIYTGRRVNTIPGFFRPTKDWDIVLVHGGQLLAALELKAQAGPSFGNNYNNRVEEALGNSEDLWTAYREGSFGVSPQPWLGYLFLLEDCPGTRSPVRVGEHHFPVLPEFVRASYAKRYELLCKKLVLERKYAAACFLLSDRTRAAANPNYSVPARELSPRRFVDDLLRHITPR